MPIAMIGGTGVYDPEILDSVREEHRETPYGRTRVIHGIYQEKEVVFLPRHGANHSVPPHRVNYRANIWALNTIGVERIIATTAVGSLNPDMQPGDCVLIDQFIDFTKQRPYTFFDGGSEGVVHTDVTEPYCPQVRSIIEAAAPGDTRLHQGGVYVCAEGPRYETPAEIQMMKQWGGDVVGMTNVPEVVLANELGICYATISMVTNFAAGMAEEPLSHSEVVEIMDQNTGTIRRLMMGAIEQIPAEKTCTCSDHGHE